ncbi:hypothetical protein ACQPZJ_18270 [Actinoplanes sp. CA-054009]
MRVRIALVLLAAVLIGLPAALAAGYAARTAQPGPDPAAVGAVVYPGAPVAVDDDPAGYAGRSAFLRFMNNTWGDAGSSVAPRHQPTGSPERLIAETRARLSADGWRIGPGRTDSYAFTAAKGPAAISFYAADFDPIGLNTWTSVTKRPAWWVVAADVAGGLAGAVLGGLLGLWAMRRWEARAPRARSAVGVTAFVGVLLVLPAYVQASGLSVPDNFSLIISYARWPALLGIVLLATALGGLRRTAR